VSFCKKYKILQRKQKTAILRFFVATGRLTSSPGNRKFVQTLRGKIMSIAQNSDSSDEGVPLQWVARTNSDVLGKMFAHKLNPLYERPSRLDIEAQKAIIISQRCTCLFYAVGTTIFHVKDGNFYQLSDGYNGAAKGDDDPRIVGCARVVDGGLVQGGGLCRGSHAELNAIGNCAVDTALYDDVRMMVTLHPCFSCAKQIVNRGIRTVYYLWEYGREENVTGYLQRLGVDVVRYASPFLDAWITINGYHSVGSQNK
jgi:dCMP deaminase